MFRDVSLNCPQCRHEALHHSRPRSAFERLRRRLTGRIPFRCHGCGWRGWLVEPDPSVQGPREIHRDLTDAELAGLEPGETDGAGGETT